MAVIDQPMLAEPMIKEMLMRFMMIVIPKGYESAAPDAVPSAEAVGKMMEYNKSLQKAGILLALDGLLPPSAGARISYSEGRATVTSMIGNGQGETEIPVDPAE